MGQFERRRTPGETAPSKWLWYSQCNWCEEGFNAPSEEEIKAKEAAHVCPPRSQFQREYMCVINGSAISSICLWCGTWFGARTKREIEAKEADHLRDCPKEEGPTN